MSDGKVRINFKCNQCDFPVSINKSNPPNDSDIVICLGEGCGHEFGTYAEIREAITTFGKRKINDALEKGLGVTPRWTKG